MALGKTSPQSHTRGLGKRDWQPDRPCDHEASGSNVAVRLGIARFDLDAEATAQRALAVLAQLALNGNGWSIDAPSDETTDPCPVDARLDVAA
eukprot:11562662-Alexandrium_andersonii.AAC.1